jgi:hypothetical protein
VDRYIYDRTELRKWLEQMRTHGHTLALITNSHADYSDFLCTFCLGSDWRSLFDCTVVYSLKPAFFSKTATFFQVTELGEEGKEITEVECDQEAIYARGNSRDLAVALQTHHRLRNGQVNGHLIFPIRSLCKYCFVYCCLTHYYSCWKQNGNVFYFGDSMVGDVIAVSLRTNWRAIAIVEEIDQSNPAIQSSQPFWGTMLSWKPDQSGHARVSYWLRAIRNHAQFVLSDVTNCSRFATMTDDELVSLHPFGFQVVPFPNSLSP